jgi:hypothetical protein
MPDAQECERQADLCREEARVTERPQASRVLLSMARSWTILANQMDRLQEIQEGGLDWNACAR